MYQFLLSLSFPYVSRHLGIMEPTFDCRFDVLETTSRFPLKQSIQHSSSEKGGHLH